jgi:beta-1,4-mannosyl-glycoprotein beta-1,4-N-acetylglucosaminyltransferase
MKYWDCFLFNGEKECLQIRAEELKPLNVHHVLVDSRYSFTGRGQKIPFLEMTDREEFYQYDIQEWVVDTLPIVGSAWNNEINQRNEILIALKELGAKDEDIVIISDADEIPSLKAIQSYSPEMGLTSLKMDNFWYNFNCLTERQSWLPVRIMTYEYLKDTTPNNVRISGYNYAIDNGGWHFSYLGDADFIIKKLESFSHQEYNKPEYKDPETILKKIRSGESLWGDAKFKFIPIDETFPKYLYENQNKFRSLIGKV